MYAFIGKKIKLIIDPLMDNPEVWNRQYSTILPGVLLRSHSAFIFDTSPARVDGGGTRPFICKYYYGIADYFMNKVNGLVTLENGLPTVATNSSLASKLEIVYNCTTQLMNPAAHAYVFLTA